MDISDFKKLKLRRAYRTKKQQVVWRLYKNQLVGQDPFWINFKLYNRINRRKLLGRGALLKIPYSVMEANAKNYNPWMHIKKPIVMKSVEKPLVIPEVEKCVVIVDEGPSRDDTVIEEPSKVSKVGPDGVMHETRDDGTGEKGVASQVNKISD